MANGDWIARCLIEDSRARAAAVLALLDEVDLHAMIEDDGRALVGCEFCGGCYAFSGDEVGHLRRKSPPARSH